MTQIRLLPSLAIWALVLLLAACRADAQTLTGRVVKIADGDTLTLLVDREQYRIRLAQIDTPERGQPWGSRAKQALSKLAFDRQARVEVEDRDQYGRYVGTVYVDGRDINAEMVATGNAWVYRRYAHDPKLYDHEEAARADRRGLWSLPEAQRIPPWEWRHR